MSGVGEPIDMPWKGCQLIYDFGRHLIRDLELGFPRSNLKIFVSEKWDGMWARGGYSVRKMMGVCRWPLKIGPKKIEGKMKFGA